MRLRFVVVALATGFAVAPVSMQAQTAAEIEALVESLGLETPVGIDPECLPAPPRAEPLALAAVFSNEPPIFPDSAGFSTELCPAGSAFYALASGRGESIAHGDLIWQEHYCALAGARLFAEGHFEFTAGDSLRWDAVVWADTLPPPIPNATFSGMFLFKPGSGRFELATGSAKIVAWQLGDAPSGRPAGSTAVVVCGWVATSASR